MTSELLPVLRETAEAVAAALAAATDWGLAGTRAGQYRSDLAADRAAIEVLGAHGFGVLSEETGIIDGSGGEVVVIVDPVDGSTNAAAGIPWFATSMCAVVGGVAVASLVENLATGERFEAVRGVGAWRNGEPMGDPGSRPGSLADAFIGLSGLPPSHGGWRQYRALGAAALDLCSVASGRLDGFVDCSFDAHGVWDYAGAFLVCAEVGIDLVDARGRDLLVLDHAARRTPVVGATAELTDELLRWRRTW